LNWIGMHINRSSSFRLLLLLLLCMLWVMNGWMDGSCLMLLILLLLMIMPMRVMSIFFVFRRYCILYTAYCILAMYTVQTFICLLNTPFVIIITYLLGVVYVFFVIVSISSSSYLIPQPIRMTTEPGIIG